MNIIFYDVLFFVIAIVLTSFFLYRNKKNIKKEGVFILYRTKFGIKAINKFAKKKRLISNLEKPIIILGYILMIGGLVLLIKITYLFLKIPKELVNVTRVPPVMPLIPYFTSIFKANWLPPFYFTYWIIIIAITTISHEFLHGIFFKKIGVKIKSTGFAFLGPFLAAFVEPDEKSMKKKEKRSMAAIASGSVSNFLIALVSLLLLWSFFSIAFSPAGVRFDSYAIKVINVSDITEITNQNFSLFGKNLTKILIDNKTYFAYTDYLKKNKEKIIVFEDTPALKKKIRGVIIEIDNKSIKDIEDLEKMLSIHKPGDTVIIKTYINNSIEIYNVTLSSKEKNNSEAYLGIVIFKRNGLLRSFVNKILFFKKEGTYYKPKFNQSLVMFIYNLIWWLFIINLGVALFNMIPAGIFDGGRFFYITMLKITKSKKKAENFFRMISLIILSILILITFIWFFNFFNK